MKLLNLLSLNSIALKVVVSVITIISSPTYAAYNSKIGINKGQRQIIQCSQDQYAVGINAVHNNKVIMKIKLRCAGVDRNTGSATSLQSWSPESTSTRNPGATGGLRTINVSCSPGEFLSGTVQGYIGTLVRRGKTPSPAISGLSGQCVRFSNIHQQAGQSRRQMGRTIRAGAEFNNRRTSEEYIYGATYPNQLALSGLRVYSDYALNSFWVQVKAMPWAKTHLGNSSSAATPVQQVQRPDLYVSPQSGSAVWRYTATFTTSRGARLRQVSDAFCSSGLIASSDKFGAVIRTKTFTLPPIRYTIVNAGGTTLAPATATDQFEQTNSIGIPTGTRSGQRINRIIRRNRAIQRCVVKGTNFGPGCYQCPTTTDYQDPQLIIRVDTTNALAESNESNNVFTK